MVELLNVCGCHAGGHRFDAFALARSEQSLQVDGRPAALLDPPPSVDGDPDTGAWLALGAAVAMCLGTLLTLGRVSFALTVEGRDTRRRVSAVDARTDPTTSEGPAVTTGRTRKMGGEEK